MNPVGLLGFISMPGTTELVVIGVVALLIFGRRLPEVARSLGKGIVEFKKGLADVEAEVDRAGSDYETDTTTEALPTETGTEDQVEGPDQDAVNGIDESEDVGAEGARETEDPVDEADTYQAYDTLDGTSDDEDEAAQEERADEDTRRAHRDDAYPSD